VYALLIVLGGLGVAAASAALWLRGRSRIELRLFAALVTAAVTLSLFSVVAWVATVIATTAPWPLIWALVAVLALWFAVRLYRELRLPPSSEAR
jgi:hypothetical protein